jgi:hypothetical protein
MIDLPWVWISPYNPNSWIKDEARPHLDRHLFIGLYTDRQPQDVYMEDQEKLERLPSFVSMLSLEEIDIFTFRVPDEYVYDFECYREGKYSLMSQEYKNKVLASYRDSQGVLKNKGIPIRNALYPNEELRRSLCARLNIVYGVDLPEDAEICTRPGKEEVLVYDQLVNLV